MLREKKKFTVCSCTGLCSSSTQQSNMWLVNNMFKFLSGLFTLRGKQFSARWVKNFVIFLHKNDFGRKLKLCGTGSHSSLSSIYSAVLYKSECESYDHVLHPFFQDIKSQNFHSIAWQMSERHASRCCGRRCGSALYLLILYRNKSRHSNNK